MRKFFIFWYVLSLLYGVTRLIIFRFQNPEMTETQLILHIPEAMGFYQEPQPDAKVTHWQELPKPPAEGNDGR